MNFCNQNNLSYSEKINTCSKHLIIDSNVCNRYFMVILSTYKNNARTSITDITFDIELNDGEIGSIEYRISYNKLIEILSDL